mmetsp:Transcript_76218/g.217748  ORF Transcript_76218/g.217748 Transcript_76218/m.217748 type:complete len:325 (+) Transcript_76218:78-1052(+)
MREVDKTTPVPPAVLSAVLSGVFSAVRSVRGGDHVAWRLLEHAVGVDHVVLLAEVVVLVEHLAHHGRRLDHLARRLVGEAPVDVEHHVVVRHGDEVARLELGHLHVLLHLAHQLPEVLLRVEAGHLVRDPPLEHRTREVVRDPRQVTLGPTCAVLGEKLLHALDRRGVVRRRLARDGLDVADAVVLLADHAVADHLAHERRGLDELAGGDPDEGPIDVEEHVVIDGAPVLGLELGHLHVLIHRSHELLERGLAAVVVAARDEAAEHRTVDVLVHAGEVALGAAGLELGDESLHAGDVRLLQRRLLGGGGVELGGSGGRHDDGSW